jgi:16S rRNA processing protein RimM
MIDLNDCIEFGQITKSHGVKGEVIVKFAGNFGFDDIIRMEQVFFIIDGLPVPFFISDYYEKPPDSIIIKYDDIDNEDKAREFVNTFLYIAKSCIKQPDFSPSNKIRAGYHVIDLQTGFLGIIQGITGTEENPVLIVDKDKKEILIPANADYILSVNHRKKEVKVNVPQGLLNL